MRLPVYERRAGVSPLSMPQVQAAPQVGDNGETAAKTLHGVFTRLEEIQNGMEDARTLELFNRFKQDSQEYHENPDKGIYNTRLGYHASGIYQEADQWLRRKGEDYARELPSRRAQFNFRKMAREHIQQRGMQNSRFEADQVKKYQQETADATIKERLNYAESHWNDDAAIAQVRTDIQQALELKMRGSGKEAFDAAMMDIEDQIGIARIRQAVIQNPLLGVDMLSNPDVYLKAGTRANLTEYLKNRTKIYKIYGIVQAYARQYSPENAVEAQKVLIQRYGPDEGQKAFAALVRHWNIQRSQDSARKQQQHEQQEKNENEMLHKWNDFLSGNTTTMPDVQEISRREKSGEISHTFAYSMINRVMNKLETDKKEQAKHEKLYRDTLIFAAESNGQFFSDEELVHMVTGGVITDDEARAHQSRRAAYSQRLEQEENKRLEDNKQNFMEKLLRGELTEEMISEAVGNTILKPSDAQTLNSYLRTEREKKDAELRRDTQETERLRKKAQEDFEGSLRIILGNGGRISKAQATELYDAGKIGQSFLEHLYSLEDQHLKEQARAQNEQAKIQTKEQAEAQKLQEEYDDDQLAMRLADMYPDGITGDGLEEIKRLNLPPKRRDNIEKRYINYVKNNKQRTTDIENLQADTYKKRYSYLWYRTSQFVNTQDEINAARKEFEHMRGNDELEKPDYNELISMLNEKERKLNAATAQREKEQTQRQKQQEKVTAEQRKDTLDKYVKNFIIPTYGVAKEGDAREFLHNLPDSKYSREEKDFMISRLEVYLQDAKTQAKNTTEAAQKVLDDTYNNMVIDIIGRSLTDEEIAQYMKTYDDMRKRGDLDDQKYDRLIAVLNKQQHANDEAAKEKRKNDNYKIASDYAEQSGLDGQHDARKKIREEYQGTRANEIITQFDRLIQEKQEEQNTQDKALRLQQEQNFTDLQNQYWRKGQIIPEQLLLAHEQNKTLTTAQLGQIRTINAKMTDKNGRREIYARNNAEAWAAMSPHERETAIMRDMGVSEDSHREAVTYLFQKAVDGTLTNAEIEDFRADARIYDSEAEDLREYDTKFSRKQREKISLAGKEIQQIIRELYGTADPKGRMKAWNEAFTKFQMQTFGIDTHDKNFDDTLTGISQSILQDIMSDYESSHQLTERVFPYWGKDSVVPTQAGERADTAREQTANFSLPQTSQAIPYSPMSGGTQFISPAGTVQDSRPAPVMPEKQTQQQLEQARSVWQEILQGVTDYFGGNMETFPTIWPDDNTPVPDVQPVQTTQTVNPQSGIETVESIAPSAKYRITSEYSTKPTALRNGRGHLAIDWGMPIGTQLFVPTYSNTWRVISTGENSTAGKFVKFQTTTASGDVYEYTYAHLSSVGVEAGDVITSGDAIAKSGNTGHSTGPHLHVAVKKNGKPIDPRSIDVRSIDIRNNTSSGDVQGFVPEPIVSPDIPQDSYARMREILFGSSADNILFGSGVYDPNGNYGGNW